LTQTEKDTVNWLYDVMRKHYDGVGAYWRFGVLFGNLWVVFELFLNKAN
jgi:hypothetical protein